MPKKGRGAACQPAGKHYNTAASGAHVADLREGGDACGGGGRGFCDGAAAAPVAAVNES